MEHLISTGVERPGIIWMEPTIILRGGGYPPLPLSGTIVGEACLTVCSMPILAQDPKWQSLNLQSEKGLSTPGRWLFALLQISETHSLTGDVAPVRRSTR